MFETSERPSIPLDAYDLERLSFGLLFLIERVRTSDPTQEFSFHASEIRYKVEAVMRVLHHMPAGERSAVLRQAGEKLLIGAGLPGMRQRQLIEHLGVYADLYEPVRRSDPASEQESRMINLITETMNGLFLGRQMDQTRTSHDDFIVHRNECLDNLLNRLLDECGYDPRRVRRAIHLARSKFDRKGYSSEDREQLRRSWLSLHARLAHRVNIPGDLPTIETSARELEFDVSRAASVVSPPEAVDVTSELHRSLSPGDRPSLHHLFSGQEGVSSQEQLHLVPDGFRKRIIGYFERWPTAGTSRSTLRESYQGEQLFQEIMQLLGLRQTGEEQVRTRWSDALEFAADRAAAYMVSGMLLEQSSHSRPQDVIDGHMLVQIGPDDLTIGDQPVRSLTVAFIERNNAWYLLDPLWAVERRSRTHPTTLTRLQSQHGICEVGSAELRQFVKGGNFDPVACVQHFFPGQVLASGRLSDESRDLALVHTLTADFMSRATAARVKRTAAMQPNTVDPVPSGQWSFA